MKKQALSERQREIYTFIKNFKKQNGCSPTYHEIAEQFNMADSGAFDVVSVLENKGYIQRDRRPRMMKVL